MDLKVAIIHFWLVWKSGAEKVLEALCELFPGADLFTHVYIPSVLSETVKKHQIRTTFIQHLPSAARHYRKYLPLMPLALERLDLRGYDLVISSEAGPAKGVIVQPDALHICYCHTPMRYLWDMYHDHLSWARGVYRLFVPILSHYMRMWDLASASRVDHFIANSSYVAKRIMKYYRRSAEIIHPPVDTQSFVISDEPGDYYLLIGRLVPYKRVDLAIEAFNQMGKKLVVIGEGYQQGELAKRAKSNITFLGYQPFSAIREYYSRCQALIFPSVEDFGIVPVEAMASGRPVIAFRRGGALDTVVDGVSGLFFEEQTPDSLIKAVRRYETIQSQFTPDTIRKHTLRFDRKYFKKSINKSIQSLLGE